MLRPYFIAGIIAVVSPVLATAEVNGQDYPSKPLRIFASTAGGSTDLLARLLAQGIGPVLGQQIVVENRGALVAIETLAKTPPDGYTLLVMGVPLWLTPLVQDNVSWDPVRDFAPISVLTRQSYVLAVHPSLPVKTVKDLIALAKAKPGQLNYSHSAIAGAPHLAAELFKSMAGVNIMRINYKENAGVIRDLIAGEVQLTFAPLIQSRPHLNSGRLRGIAVTSLQPSPLTPELPTIAATLPGYELVENAGLFAPAKTPAPIILRLNQEVARLLNRPDIKERFLVAGSEAVATSPEEFSAVIKSDMTRLGKVIKDAGIRAD